MSKTSKEKNNSKRKAIEKKQNKDGSVDYFAQSPTKTVFGKIVVFCLAISMVLVVVAGLVVVLLQQAGVIK